MTFKDYILQKHHAQRKMLKYKLCSGGCQQKDANCEVHDLLLKVVDLKQEVPDRWDTSQFNPCVQKNVTRLQYKLPMPIGRLRFA